MPTAAPIDRFQLIRPAASHEQITAFLREQILSGALAPQARLPTTQELTRRWGVPIATIQRAFVPLVREGLLLRRPGFGTVVRGSAAALTSVGIYQPVSLDWQGGERFANRLAELLVDHLVAAGLAAPRFYDRRPGGERSQPLPELAQAARSRQIDAVIAVETDANTSAWIDRLPVPSALYGSGGKVNQLWFDMPAFAAQGLAGLAARGCRRVGLVTVLPADPSAPQRDLAGAFRDQLAAHGLETRPEWIRMPGPGQAVIERDAERFGYEEIHALWSGAERPDGLLVYTDHVAHGVVMGLLSLGVQAAPPHLMLHRNAGLDLFCPLPADFLESSAQMIADRLMALIVAQHQRRRPEPDTLGFRLVAGRDRHT